MPTPAIIHLTLKRKRSNIIAESQTLNKYPYLGNDTGLISDELFSYCITSQAYSLKRRLLSIGSQNTVIGVSGGLDSTHALMVLHHLYLTEGWDMANIHCFVMPSSANSSESQDDAIRLIEGLGLTANVRPIDESVSLMIKQLGRDPSDLVYDTTYENIQAGHRTSFMFRYANMVGGIVIGTGDLSEIALGWCTYGVGDQMSHFNLNCGLPKTVIKAIVKKHAQTHEIDVVRSACGTIASRDISPELLPSSAVGEEMQRTEEQVGNYDYIDFLLFHTLESGPTSELLQRMLFNTFTNDDVPDDLVDELHSKLDFAFNSFSRRFYNCSQFKREAIPNGPKILKNGSLSPRGDWRFPVDSHFHYQVSLK